MRGWCQLRGKSKRPTWLRAARLILTSLAWTWKSLDLNSARGLSAVSYTHLFDVELFVAELLDGEGFGEVVVAVLQGEIEAHVARHAAELELELFEGVVCLLYTSRCV